MHPLQWLSLEDNQKKPIQEVDGRHQCRKCSCKKMQVPRLEDLPLGLHYFRAVDNPRSGREKVWQTEQSAEMTSPFSAS